MEPIFLEPGRGTLVGAWRVLEHVGSGANGFVFRVCLAERPGEGSFALKLSREPGDPRFEREAGMLSRLEHPHVPGFRDKGTWTDPAGRERLYLVMQWVDGVPLYYWAEHRRVTSRQVLRLLGQLARALEATHRHGTHRDVKGDNVLVCADGNAVLLDYGCCWYAGARPLTDTVVPPGTWPYRSPECLRFRYRQRKSLDSQYLYPPEDDLYALGVTAYRLVTGTYPPPGTDPECADNPGRARPPPRMTPRELATVHPVLEAIIERLLSTRAARGIAERLAEDCEKAVASLGAAADLPIQAHGAKQEAPQPDPPQSEPPRGDWLREQAPWLAAGAATLSAAGLLLLVLFRCDEPEELGGAPPRQAQVVESRDGGVAEEVVEKKPVGVADAGIEEAVASVVKLSSAEIDPESIGRDIPSEPRKGQRRPPCTLRKERAINGACWISLDVDAPCDKGDFEWDGRCYMPSLTSERQPTSDDKQ